MHYTPGPPLSEFVSIFWHFKGVEVPDAKERVLPTGSVDWIIRLDSGRSADSGIFGPRTRSVVIQTASGYEANSETTGRFSHRHSLPRRERRSDGNGLSHSRVRCPAGWGDFQIL
jgi:hypothetical protein